MGYHILRLSGRCLSLKSSIMKCLQGLTCPHSTGGSTTTPSPSTGTTGEPAPKCQNNVIPKLEVHDKKKGVKKWTLCRDRCNEDPECEYFKWKKNKCFMMTVDWKAKNSWVSG